MVVFPRPFVGPTGLIPEAVRRIVTVIHIPDRNARPVPIGTGFLIRYPSVVRPDGGYKLLVTARHVVTDERGDLRPELMISANRVGGGTELFAIAADEERGLPPAHFHPNPSVDLCVLPAGFDPNVFEIAELVAEFFPPAANLRAPLLREGAETLFVALFMPLAAHERILPIVRFGKVALVPVEPIIWREHGPAEQLVVIEAQSFPGNSGAPVFVFLGDQDGAGQPIPRLLGVLKGAFSQRMPGEFDENPAIRFSVQSAVGVSAVVPAYLLKQLLDEVVIPELDIKMHD
jgi:hypothetical protein